VKKHFWLRFTSPHPQDFSEELIQIAKNDPRVIRQFHIPLQSGSDKILRLMNRPYSKEQFRSIIERIKVELPDIEFTTDMIVGFCDETDADFEETLEFVKEMEFSNSYTAKYSPRPNTTAVNFEDNVDYSVKKDREHRLMDAIRESTYKLSQKLVGTDQEVLIERFDQDKKLFVGRLFNNKTIRLENPDLKVGEFYKCRIIDAFTWGFRGTVQI
jgi:tRNA-2-methylthio-N6-dimethylallyladenosine synthase